MNIDFEMIIPTNIAQVSSDGESMKYTNYYIRNNCFLERVEAGGQNATVFKANTDIVLRRYQTDFKIIKALYVTFTSKTPEDYLCFAGENQLDFYSIADNLSCSLALAFKISQVHPYRFGIILERNCVLNSPINTPHFYSLTHPYNEIFPILCKSKDSTNCFYAFQRNVKIVPMDFDIGHSFSIAELVMAYDFEDNTNHIYMIRKCSREERLAAKQDLEQIASCSNTPNSLHSFNSPNFFLRRFGQNSLERPHMISSFDQTSLRPNNSGSTGSIPRTITPIRRTICTRSMLAGAYENVVFKGSSSTVGSFGSSYDRSVTQSSLYMKMHEASLNKKKKKSSNSVVDRIFHSTPNRAQFEHEDLLSFGVCGDEEPNSIDIAVEFCFDWLWSESLPKKEQGIHIELDAPSSTTAHLSPENSTNGHFKHLNVTCPENVIFFPSVQKHCRMADMFFVTKDIFGQHFVVFHVPSDTQTYVLKIVGTSSILEFIHQGSAFSAFSCAPFLAQPFFAVMERINVGLDASDFSFMGHPPISPSGPSIAIYSGTHKIGNVALNFASVFDCSQLMTALRTFLRVIPSGPKSFDLEYKESCSERRYFLRCDFQMELSTHIASRCFTILCEGLPKEQQISYFSHFICTNPWRIVNAAGKIPQCHKFPVSHLEVCLLLEHFLSEVGIDSPNLPFLNPLRVIRGFISKSNDGDFLQEDSISKKTKFEKRNLDKNEYFEKCWQMYSKMSLVKSNVSSFTVKSSLRPTYLTDKTIFKMFTVLHDIFESLKLDRSYRNLLPLIAEALFIFCIVYQLDKFENYYKTDFPDLGNLFQDPYTDSVMIRDNTNFTQRFRKHTDLRETFNVLVTGFNSPGSSPHIPQFYDVSGDLCPTRVLTCLAIALGRIQSSGNLPKYLGKQWAKRLMIDKNEQLKKSFTDILDNEALAKEKKCSMSMELLDLPMSQLKFLNDELLSVFQDVLKSGFSRQQNFLLVSKLKVFPTFDEQQRWTSLRWREDIRLHNALQMLDSSLPTLIPVNARTAAILTDAQIREEQEQFLLQIAVKTITRPFGQALCNFRSERPMLDEIIRVQPICLNGRVNPGKNHVKFPASEETNANHKSAMDWAHFYNGIAHGLAVLGFGNSIGRSKRYLGCRGEKRCSYSNKMPEDKSFTSLMGLTLGAGSGIDITSTTVATSVYHNSPKLHLSKKNKPCNSTRSEASAPDLLSVKNSANIIRNGAIVPHSILADEQESNREGKLIVHPPLFASLTNSDVPEVSNVQASLIFSTFTEEGAQPSVRGNDQSSMPFTHLFGGALSFDRKDEVVLDWDWLSKNVFKANENMPTVQAGLLLAAGLTGHIRSINMYDVHTFLSKNDRFVSIALLIGCAVAFRGTADVHIYKVLTTHLPFMLQPTLCELKIESCVQTAAMISMGLLFAETANLSLVDQLLNQMSLEVFEGDQCSERYSFALAIGFAIGLINLGKGRAIEDTEIPISSNHISIKERLIKLLYGGERKYTFVSYDKMECPAIRSSSALLATTGSTQIPRRYTPGPGGPEHLLAEELNHDDVILNVNSLDQTANEGLASVGTGTRNWYSGLSLSGSSVIDRSGIGALPSHHVRERPNVNIHITSPAACVALGLMYLRTGDRWIIDTLAIPDNFHAIEKIRPDMLMIRTLCRCLVDFNNIGTDVHWLLEQIPPIVRKYEQKLADVTHSGLSPHRHRQLLTQLHIDASTVSQAFYYCAAGACFAMSLRYASTWNKAVFNTINWLHETSQLTENNSLNRRGSFAERAGKNCVNSCTNVAAICFGLVMAGSGDLETFRILRKIRNLKPKWSPPSSIDTSVHSLHVFGNMAIGLLFLSHGRLGLSRSNNSIAILLISFFPLFAHTISDNRLYFQPLRFLWALALEPRHLVTVDSQTLEAISVDITIIFKDFRKEAYNGHTPTLLPPINTISRIRLAQQNKFDATNNDEKPELVSVNVESSSSEESGSDSENTPDDNRTKGRRIIFEKPTTKLYNPVELNLAENLNDMKKLKNVLYRFFGRFPLSRCSFQHDQSSLKS